MTTSTESVPTSSGSSSRREVAGWLGLYAGFAVVLGGLAAVFWSAVVDLPTYRILADGSAAMSERSLVGVVAADAWFVVTGAIVGIGLGLVAWRWFSPLGWTTAVLAAAAGLVAGMVCWGAGGWLGPGPEAERLAAAQPGEVVPISLTLRSWSALAVWGLAGVAPVLLISALARDPEDPRLRRRDEDVASPDLDASQDPSAQ